MWLAGLAKIPPAVGGERPLVYLSSSRDTFARIRQVGWEDCMPQVHRLQTAGWASVDFLKRSEYLIERVGMPGPFNRRKSDDWYWEVADLFSKCRIDEPLYRALANLQLMIRVSYQLRGDSPYCEWLPDRKGPQSLPPKTDGQLIADLLQDLKLSKTQAYGLTWATAQMLSAVRQTEGRTRPEFPQINAQIDYWYQYLFSQIQPTEYQCSIRMLLEIVKNRNYQVEMDGFCDRYPE